MNYFKTNKAIFLLPVIILVLVFAFIFLFRGKTEEVPNLVSVVVADVSESPNNSKVFAMPIDNAKSRITKKHFGTYVTPEKSPVTPEVFTGYHTAIDFETLASEVDRDIPIYAICSGKISIKKEANGYGGMVVQNCSLDGSFITVIYGHVRLKDMKAEVGDLVEKGEFLTHLGTGFSTETGNERKHLHLGIHKGSGIDTRGYVAKEDDLKNWIDFEGWAE